MSNIISDIKDKRKRNNVDELSKHFQNAKIVIRQKSNIIFEKTIQSKTKNDNEKILNYEFNQNDAIDYTAFIEKERAQNKNLEIKGEY